MKCSIIVPVYNMEAYIVRALQSIQDQVYQNIEAIIVDDGSTDNSAETIKDFIGTDHRFKYFYFENGGLGKARNIGLSLAGGQYVTFLDADDWLEPNYIQDCMLIKNNCEIVVQHRRFHYQEIVEQVEYPSFPKNLFQDINVSCTNKIYERQFIKSFCFHEGTLYEDIIFHLSVIQKRATFKRGRSFYNVEKRNERSITSVVTERHLDLLENIEACWSIVTTFDRKTKEDFQVYAFKSSLYLIFNFKILNLPIAKYYKIFTLKMVLNDRYLLRLLLFIALFLPSTLWMLMKKIKKKVRKKK